MRCEKCGRDLPENAKFCPVCGGSLRSNQAAPANEEKPKAYENEQPLNRNEYPRQAVEAEPYYEPHQSYSEPHEPQYNYVQQPQQQQIVINNSNMILQDYPGAGGWFLRLFGLSIPVIGQILLIVWALGGTSYPAVKTFARGVLLFFIIPLIVSIILISIYGLSIFGIASSI